MLPEEDFLAAEEALRRAMLSSDVAALDALLSDDLLFVSHTGHVLDKESDLESHRSGALRLTRVDFTDTHFRYLSAGAVVVVHAALSGEFQGARFEGNFRYTRVWQVVDDAPQVVAAQCTAVG
ncbi:MULTISPECIES: nuclear transport factor 2 family protein [unclassified Myxococcus]|uniref:nuclear transport factor 2 family protein n=1 Tax=unclassified Myxococcus TaxID=2648731 RepID=UPI001E465D28|nr:MULTISPECIES: nuclear transport factor 2 family protein [unclassified Myxococcus]